MCLPRCNDSALCQADDVSASWRSPTPRLCLEGDTKVMEWLQTKDARASCVPIVIFKERTG
jgi:hypothetical protein